MSGAPAPIELAKCGTCHHRFAPADGVCPRCASSSVEPFSVPPVGVVLAATEVAYPSEGWPAPHRLALVELAESVRLLVVPEAPLPAVGDLVELRPGPGYYRAFASGHP